MKIKDSVLIISPLVAGFLVYFSCRTKNLVYYHWLPFKGYVGLDSLHFMVNEKCREILIGTVGGDITVYSIPGALYAFSLTYYLKLSCFKNTYVLRPTRFGRIIFCLALIFLVSVLPELFQFYGLLPGYFDVIDVLTAVFASLIALMLSWKFRKACYKEKTSRYVDNPANPGGEDWLLPLHS